MGRNRHWVSGNSTSLHRSGRIELPCDPKGWVVDCPSLVKASYIERTMGTLYGCHPWVNVHDSDAAMIEWQPSTPRDEDWRFV
jgi:hypothetical protein